MCKVLEVSPSGYYAWRKRPESATVVRRRRLTVMVKAIHEQSRQNYGSPRVFKELQARGERCNVKTVARIMRKNEIVAKRRRKFKVTTDSNHRLPVAKNLLDRKFTVTAPNRVWVTDITYIPTWEGWLYLATVQDLFSRKIVGWSMQPRMTRQLVIDALEMAVDRRRPEPGLLCHSDRGSQYASDDYQAVLARHGMVCSMSRKGNCWDNAVMESFYSTLKTELIYHEVFHTRDEARRAVFEYIEMFYNHFRRHSTLGYLSPVDFELAA
jgi:transposase InsO family protein